jgi:hypothetical protein
MKQIILAGRARRRWYNQLQMKDNNGASTGGNRFKAAGIFEHSEIMFRFGSRNEKFTPLNCLFCPLNILNSTIIFERLLDTRLTRFLTI